MVIADTPEHAREIIDELAEKGVDFVKLYELLTPEVFEAAITRAHEHGLKAIGHIPATVTTVQALEAGLDGIEHIRGLEFDCAADPEGLLSQRLSVIDAHHGEKGAIIRRHVHAEVRPEAFETQDEANCEALIELLHEKQNWQAPTLQVVGFRALGYYKKPGWLDAYDYLTPALRADWERRYADFTNEEKYKEWKDHGFWTMNMVKKLYYNS